MKDTYTLTVIFTRSKSADLEVARARNLSGDEDDILIKQLRDELQEACDEHALDGQFRVVTRPRYVD